MRIRVVYKEGIEEILTVVGPLVVTESNRDNGMSHFQDATGTDFFFNDDDGTYDGWGRGGPFTAEEMDGVIEQVGKAREFVDGKAGGSNGSG